MLDLKLLNTRHIFQNPSDFHLFSKLKEHTRGTKFEEDDAVMTAVDEFFDIKIFFGRN
jgi:hypothetical protein